jgi:phospholipid N-methyltransferase
MSKRTFLKAFIKENKMVGSITPSSRFLASKMLDKIDFSKQKVIVELGPGTGVFTRKIIARLPDSALLLVFELNEVFCEKLKLEFDQKNVQIIHDSADQIEVYLRKYGYESADVIISSLPLANIDTSIRENIVQSSSKVLKLGGNFIQFQYSLQSKSLLKNNFNKVEIGFTALNIPPAFVYTCTK